MASIDLIAGKEYWFLPILINHHASFLSNPACRVITFDRAFSNASGESEFNPRLVLVLVSTRTGRCAFYDRLLFHRCLWR